MRRSTDSEMFWPSFSPRKPHRGASLLQHSSPTAATRGMLTSASNDHENDAGVRVHTGNCMTGTSSGVEVEESLCYRHHSPVSTTQPPGASCVWAPWDAHTTSICHPKTSNRPRKHALLNTLSPTVSTGIGTQVALVINPPHTPTCKQHSPVLPAVYESTQTLDLPPNFFENLESGSETRFARFIVSHGCQEPGVGN